MAQGHTARHQLQRLSSNPEATLSLQPSLQPASGRASRGYTTYPVQNMFRIGVQMFPLLSSLCGCSPRSTHCGPLLPPALRGGPPRLPGCAAPGSPHTPQLLHSGASSASWTRARPLGRVECSWWTEAQVSDKLNTMEQGCHTTVTKAHARCSFF